MIRVHSRDIIDDKGTASRQAFWPPPPCSCPRTGPPLDGPSESPAPPAIPEPLLRYRRGKRTRAFPSHINHIRALLQETQAMGHGILGPPRGRHRKRNRAWRSRCPQQGRGPDPRSSPIIPGGDNITILLEHDLSSFPVATVFFVKHEAIARSLGDRGSPRFAGTISWSHCPDSAPGPRR